MHTLDCHFLCRLRILSDVTASDISLLFTISSAETGGKRFCGSYSTTVNCLLIFSQMITLAWRGFLEAVASESHTGLLRREPLKHH